MSFGEELRHARVEHGLSQADVGAAASLSRVHVGRIERGVVAGLSFYHVCRLASVVGLDLSIRAYPSRSPFGDAAHRALLDRAALPSPGSWHPESPLPLPNDQRAWDTVLQLGQSRVAFEAETHVSDLQALRRREGLKRRDDPSIGAIVLLLADTKHNRRVLREHDQALAADFPPDCAAVAQALAAGRLPVAHSIVLA